MPNFEESYLGQLVHIRKATGADYRFILSAARAILRDPQGCLLFVRRSDNGRWVMPSGSQELDESIVECMKREVREETGLTVETAKLMALYNYPCTADNFYQTLHVQFLVQAWSGELLRQTDETTDGRFWDLDEILAAIPGSISPYYRQVIEDYQRYDGEVILR